VGRIGIIAILEKPSIDLERARRPFKTMEIHAKNDAKASTLVLIASVYSLAGEYGFEPRTDVVLSLMLTFSFVFFQTEVTQKTNLFLICRDFVREMKSSTRRRGEMQSNAAGNLLSAIIIAGAGVRRN